MRIILLLCLCSLYIFAEAIDLKQALDLIKHNNLEIKSAEYDIQSASFSLDMANAQDYGQLNFIQNISRSNDAGNVFGFKLASREAAFGDFGFDEFLAQMGGLPGNADQLLSTQPNNLNYPDARDFFQSKLVYELPLYTGNKISAYQEMAKEMKRISVLDKEAQVSTKVYETRKSYFDMALLEGSLKNLQIILGNINRLESTTEEMITEGYAKKIDLLEVQSKKANILRIITELESNEELLYHYLSFLLNQDVTEIETPGYDLVEPKLSAEEILDKSIDIKKALAALRIRDNMLIAEESRYLPVIGAMAEIQTADDTFLGDANDHKSYTLGLQLKWNLFSGGSDSASIQKAQVEKLKMISQTELAKQGIALKIKEIQTKIKRAESKIRNLDIELRLAREIYENYEGRYKEQLSSMSDVIIKQSEWLEKVLQLLQAQNERNTQIFALERLALIQGDN
jgi:outer membrane protein TolC